MFISAEEMCLWCHSSEVQTRRHQEAGGGGGEGAGRQQGGDGGGGGPPEGHHEEIRPIGADAGGVTQEEWEISTWHHWQCGLQHPRQE